MSKKKTALFLIILSLLLSLCLLACGKAKNKQQGNASNSKSSTKSETEYTSKKSSSGSSKSSSDSYSIKTSSGEKLEAKPGYTAVSDTVSTSPVSEHSPSVLLPFIGDYVSGTVDIDSEIKLSGGTYETFFGFSEKKDKEIVTKYIDALSSYGCTLEKKTGSYYYLNCSKNISHGKIPYDYVTTYYDIKIAEHVDSDPYYILVEYPPEIWFDYSSVSGSQSSNSITVMSEVRYSKNKYYFYITGYAGSKDEFTVCFDPVTYSAGKTINFKDFKAQESAGDNALCKMWIKSAAGYLEYSDVIDISVNVLDANDSGVAIAFDVTYLDHTTKHHLEGVSVSKEIAENTANSGGSGISTGISTGNNKCSFCGGSGEVICHVCGGDGYEMCPNCNGTGSYWQNGVGTIPGSLKKCTRCNHGKIKCSSSRCNGGMTKCTACGGDGER